MRALVKCNYFPGQIPDENELSRMLRMPKTSITVALSHLEAEGVLAPSPDRTHYQKVISYDAGNASSGQVGLVLNTDILKGWYSVFQDWLIGFQQGFDDVGYDVTILSDFSSPEQKVEVLKQMWDRGVMGFAFGSFTEPQVRQWILENDIPAVVIGNATLYQEEIGTVCTDNKAGIRKLMEHLIELGHTGIGMYAVGVSYHDGFQERYIDYQQFMQMWELEPTHDLIFGEMHHEQMARQAAETFAQLPARPTAIICGSDREAIELIAELKHLDIHAPRDVSIVGFANNHYSSLQDPPITTIDIHGLEMGRVGANYLLNEMQSPQMPVKIYLPTELIIRNSAMMISEAEAVQLPQRAGQGSDLLTF